MCWWVQAGVLGRDILELCYSWDSHQMLLEAKTKETVSIIICYIVYITATATWLHVYIPWLKDGWLKVPVKEITPHPTINNLQAIQMKQFVNFNLLYVYTCTTANATWLINTCIFIDPKIQCSHGGWVIWLHLLQHTET